MLSTNDAVQSSFQLLVSVVRDFYAQKRPCLGATLKPELKRRTSGMFSEQQLGFGRFGDFLRAAEGAGLVQLQVTPGGDLQVWPAGIEIVTTQFGIKSEMPLQPGLVSRIQLNQDATSSPKQAINNLKVRQDLWSAFNSISGTWLYNPISDLAFRISESESANYAQHVADRGLIQIPTGKERVLEWMRAFANMQDGDVRKRLDSTLDGDNALFRFSATLKSDLNLLRAWRRFHVRQVVAAIEAWAASNGLRLHNVTVAYRDVKPYFRELSAAAPLQVPGNQQPPKVMPTQIANTAITESSALVTARIEALIDELIGELAKLRGFLHLVSPKQ